MRFFEDWMAAGSFENSEAALPPVAADVAVVDSAFGLESLLQADVRISAARR